METVPFGEVAHMQCQMPKSQRPDRDAQEPQKKRNAHEGRGAGDSGEDSSGPWDTPISILAKRGRPSGHLHRSPSSAFAL
jgi:hypothetical protein